MLFTLLPKYLFGPQAFCLLSFTLLFFHEQCDALCWYFRKPHSFLSGLPDVFTYYAHYVKTLVQLSLVLLAFHRMPRLSSTSPLPCLYQGTLHPCHCRSVASYNHGNELVPVDYIVYFQAWFVLLPLSLVWIQGSCFT